MFPLAAPSDPFHAHSRRRRAVRATLAIALFLGVLGAAFFRTQVVRSDEFVLQADDNRFRSVPIPAPRGAIFDREGRVVAETVTGYAVRVEGGGSADSARARVESVFRVLGVAPDSGEVEALAARAARSGDPVEVRRGLTHVQVARLEESRGRLSGVEVEAFPVRRYPHGEAVAHLVGYVAEISERELADTARWAGYERGRLVGRSGLERRYEPRLGGRPGSRYVEVDARGRLVGGFAPEVVAAPVAGDSLRLTLDLDLQRFAHAVFPRDKRGAVVAMVPGTGEILALYSFPTFDVNALVGGVDPELWRALNADPRAPLLNRAVAGLYPPGSTWKLATAMAGLERGLVTPERVMPLECTGGMTYAGRYARCWKREGHGPQNLLDAIANSCNVYFYQLGVWLGLDRLTREGTRLGFGRPTGVDLPGERRGIFPTGTAWYRERFGAAPQPSEVMNVAIGQGPNSQTPLRMAQFFSAIAADGVARAPHLAAGVETPVETDLGVHPATLAAVHTGLARVIERGGTAHSSALRRWKLYGKTGTAQNPHDIKKPHAWFTGFAGPEGEPPEIVVAVIVEFGESGSGAAAPLASRIAGRYLDRTHGVEVPTIEEVEAAEAARRAERPGARP